MSFCVSGCLFRFIVYFSCTEKFLSVRISIEDNTKAGCHVDNLSRSIIINILTRILAAITIDILKFISLIRLWFVYWRMICRFNNSSNPRFNSHKLFLFNFTLNNLKAIRLWVLNKFTSLTCCFVDSYTSSDVWLNKLRWFTPARSTLSFIRLTSTHKIETFNIIKKEEELY